MALEELAKLIGETFTINGVTGKLIRLKQNHAILFDGVKNHEVDVSDIIGAKKAPLIDKETNECSKCGKDKPIGEFATFKNGNYKSFCKECDKKRENILESFSETVASDEQEEITKTVILPQKENPIKSSSLPQKHSDICLELNDLYSRKNKDYGNSFGETYQKLGIISAVTRIVDKVNRLQNLSVKRDRQVADETLRDTLIDTANYAIMTVMEMDNEADL